MPKEKEALKKELAEAKVEIGELRLRLSNVTLLLQQEMRESGKLPKIGRSKDGKS
jgi:hypothetical protein